MAFPSNSFPGPFRVTSNLLTGDNGTFLSDFSVSTPLIFPPSASSMLTLTSADASPAYLKLNPGGLTQTNQFEIASTLKAIGTSTLAKTIINDLTVNAASILTGPVTAVTTMTVGSSASFGSFISVNGNVSASGAVNTNYVYTSTAGSNLLISTTDITPAYIRLNVGGLVELTRISALNGLSSFSSLSVQNNLNAGSLSLLGSVTYPNSLETSTSTATTSTSQLVAGGLTNLFRIRNKDATNLNTGLSIANIALPSGTYTDSHMSFYSMGSPETFANGSVAGAERITIGCNNGGGYLNFITNGTGVTRSVSINGGGTFLSGSATLPSLSVTNGATVSGLIRGMAGLTITGAQSSVASLITTGVLIAQSGIQASLGITTDLLTASSLIKGGTLNITNLATFLGGAKITNGLTLTGGGSVDTLTISNSLVNTGMTTLNSSSISSLIASSLTMNGPILTNSSISQSINGTSVLVADNLGNWTIPGLFTASNGASILKGLSSDTFTLPSTNNLQGSSSATAGSILTIKPATTFTDISTLASSTASSNFSSVYIGSTTLAAANSNVTTPNATSFYIAGAPTVGSNQTITNRYALWVATGFSSFNGGVGITNGLTTDMLLVTGSTQFNGQFMAPIIMATSTNDTNSPNSTTSSGQFAGGISVAKSGYYGLNLVAGGVVVGGSGIFSSSYVTSSTTCSVGTTLTVGTSATIPTVSITASTASTSTSTGALTVNGGAGVLGSVYSNITVNATTFFGRWTFNANTTGPGNAGNWNNLLPAPNWIFDACANVNSEYKATGASTAGLVSLNRAGGYIQLGASGLWDFNAVLTVNNTNGLLGSNPIEVRWYVVSTPAYRGSTAITNGTGATAGGLIGSSTYINNGSELPVTGSMILPAGARVALAFLCNVTPVFIGGAPIFIQAYMNQQLT